MSIGKHSLEPPVTAVQDFLADYGALIAPIAAIINGFIAVVVASFSKTDPAPR